MSTIFDELRLEHDAHRRMLDELAKTSGDTPERRELWRNARDELKAHARAEERAFYARLIAVSTSQKRATHSIEEHEQMNDLMDEVDEHDFDSPGWLPTLKKLRDQVVHHEDEEETSVFPVAGKVLSAKEKQAMADEFRAAKKEEVRS
jgi:hypothetical protein